MAEIIDGKELAKKIRKDLKKEVDEILGRLGITPSSLIQMLYSEIKLTHKIPLSLAIPEEKQTKEKVTNSLVNDSNKTKARRQVK